MQNKILFIGFKKAHENDNNSSYLMLMQLRSKKTFFFDNDFSCIYDEARQISGGDWNKIIMFGQKPLIKNICIERCAKYDDTILYSNFNFDLIEKMLNDRKINFKWSNHAGNSYCNYAYYCLLDIIRKRNIKTEVLFIHIPYMEKFLNMDEMVRFLKSLED